MYRPSSAVLNSTSFLARCKIANKACVEYSAIGSTFTESSFSVFAFKWTDSLQIARIIIN